MANLDGTDIVHGERLLAQRSLGWKLACSLWVLVVGFGFVLLSVLGWAAGAVLSRSRKMWVWTGVWFALYLVAMAAMEQLPQNPGVLIFVIIWIGSVAHAAYLSRGVLRARAVALARDQGWRAIPEPAQTNRPPQPPQPDMPTIPLPDGVRRQRGDLRDS